MASKIELAAIVADRLEVTKVKATSIISEVFGAINELTEDGTRLKLAGFGAFVNKTSKARIGRNIQTGEPLNIPAKTKLTFKQEGK
jgi:nucleoid DNA-binding protein